jgi:hypothetical protein
MPVRPPAHHVQQAVASVQRQAAPPTAPPAPHRPNSPGVVQRIIIPLYERSKDGSFSETQEREYKETIGGADRLAVVKERGAIRDPAGLTVHARPLKGLAEPIYLMGHGDLAAGTLGGKNAAAILAHLEGLGLRKYKGNRIILAGCETASAPTGLFDRLSGTKSLVDQLKALLAAKYPKISVVGVPGFMTVDTQGAIRSVDSKQESAFDQAMAELKKKKQSQGLSDIEVERVQAEIYRLYTHQIEGGYVPAPPPVDKARLQLEYSRLYSEKRLKAKPGVSLADPATYHLGAQFDRFLARIKLGLITIEEPGQPVHPAPAGQAPHVQSATANPAASGSQTAQMRIRPAPPVLQAKAGPRSSRLPPAVPRKVIQPMLLSLGDLAEAAREGLSLSSGERKNREAISQAVATRAGTHREKQVNPWDVAGFFSGKGALHEIGRTEPLRIYGHGQGIGHSGRIERIGGYTVAALVDKLKALGLPKDYAGEIYLTGCDTAVGESFGFLGEFYAQIRQHCAGVTVRGNLGTAVTRPDGEQWIWSGRIARSRYETWRAFLVKSRESVRGEIHQSNTLKSTLDRRAWAYKGQLDAAVRDLDRGGSVDNAPLMARGRHLATQKRRLDARMQGQLDRLRRVDAGIVDLDTLAYTRDRTVRFPMPVSAAASIPPPTASLERKRDFDEPRVDLPAVVAPEAKADVPPERREPGGRETPRSFYSRLFQQGRLRVAGGLALIDPANMTPAQLDRFLARVQANVVQVL